MDPIVTLFIGIILGTLAVAVVSFLLTRGKFDKLKSSAEVLKIQNASLEEKFTLSENLRIDAETSKELTLDQNIQLKMKTATLETQLSEQSKLFEMQKTMSEDQVNKIKVNSSEAIEANSKTFLSKASNEVIQPMKTELTNTLQKLETNLNKLNNMEKQSISLETQIQLFHNESNLLRNATEKLSSALRGTPQAPGAYGEFTLERIAELSGMVEYCDFAQQVSMRTPEGKLDRPDMVVHMPSNRKIVVDAKTSIQAYLNSMDAPNESEQQALLKQHAQQYKERVNELSRKAYWNSLEDSPDFVIMFVPGDHLLLAALKEDHTLQDHAMQSNVLIASPTFLVSLLKVIALEWRQEKLSKEAEEIRDIGVTVYDRIANWVKHLEAMGRGLETAVKSYDSAMGSLDRMVLPGVRSFKKMGVSSDKSIATPKLLHTNLREIPQSMRIDSENEHEDAI